MYVCVNYDVELTFFMKNEEITANKTTHCHKQTMQQKNEVETHKPKKRENILKMIQTIIGCWTR